MKLTAESWNEILSDIPVESLNDAYVAAVKTRESKAATFPINAAEIAIAWARSSKSDQSGPALAWSLVVAAMRVVRAPEQPKFDDPLINALIKRFGWFWMTHNEKQEDVRFAFIEAYKQLQASPKPESDGLRKELPAFDQSALPNPEIEKQIESAASGMVFDSRRDNILEGVAKMRAALGRPEVKVEEQKPDTTCGNCHLVRFKSTYPLTYFCNHESVKIEGEKKLIGHDATIQPGWCPLKKAS